MMGFIVALAALGLFGLGVIADALGRIEKQLAVLVTKSEHVTTGTASVQVPPDADVQRFIVDSVRAAKRRGLVT